MWFIEHTNVAEKSISEIKSALDILNIHYDYFGFNKKENEIYFNNEVVADFFIVRPSIQALKYIIKNEEKNDFLSKLNSDIGYNEHNFDQNYYVNTFDLPFLNQNALFLTIHSESDLFISYGKEMFVKPTSDLKIFNACVVEERKTLKRVIEENGLIFDDLKGKTVLFSDLQDITGEYRCIMKGNTLIGISKYFESGKLDLLGNIPELIIKKAQEFAKKYHPAEIYTMDLCETKQGDIKIVEYNCWNTSGLYNINLSDFFSQVNQHYKDKYN